MRGIFSHVRLRLLPGRVRQSLKIWGLLTVGTWPTGALRPLHASKYYRCAKLCLLLALDAEQSSVSDSALYIVHSFHQR